jgi:hypothetical protein
VLRGNWSRMIWCQCTRFSSATWVENPQLRCLVIRISRLVMCALVSFAILPCARVTKAQQYPESTYQEMRWRMIGPTRGGRTRASCGVRPEMFLRWRGERGRVETDDAGRTWTPIFDTQRPGPSPWRFPIQALFTFQRGRTGSARPRGWRWNL